MANIIKNEVSNDDCDYICKIVLIGDQQVGKTNILSRFNGGDFNPYTKMTIGVDIGTQLFNIKHDGGEVKIKVQLWDTVGQEKYKSMTSTYYRGMAGSILVYDISYELSFNNLSKWIEDIRRYEPNAIIIIVGNKIDLNYCREISYDEGKIFCSKYGCSFVEMSAKDDKNIDKIIKLLLEEIFASQNKENKQSQTQLYPIQNPRNYDLLEKTISNEQSLDKITYKSSGSSGSSGSFRSSRSIKSLGINKKPNKNTFPTSTHFTIDNNTKPDSDKKQFIADFCEC